MAILNGKDHGAYPDLIFYYASPSANHLYANPRKVGVGIGGPGGELTQSALKNSLHGHAAHPPEISARFRLSFKLDNKQIVSY